MMQIGVTDPYYYRKETNDRKKSWQKIPVSAIKSVPKDETGNCLNIV
jgi:hypothetical protein